MYGEVNRVNNRDSGRNEGDSEDTKLEIFKTKSADATNRDTSAYACTTCHSSELKLIYIVRSGSSSFQ